MNVLLIGDGVLNGFYTVYDRQTNSVGFAAANCGGPAGTVTASPIVVPFWGWIIVGAGGFVLLVVVLVLCQRAYNRRRAAQLTGERQRLTGA